MLRSIIPNGWMEGSKTTLNAVISFHCIDDHVFEGESFRTTCQVNLNTFKAC